jgi:RNA polymerase sigma-70 factor (ECF subfamily)
MRKRQLMTIYGAHTLARSMANTTSRSLLVRVGLAGDRDAWRHLEAVYGSLLRRWLGRNSMPVQDVEDVSQNVFVVVVRRIPEFVHNGRKGAFRTWLRQILGMELRKFHHNCLAARKMSYFEPTELDQYENPNTELSREWDRVFDAHVLSVASTMVRSEVEASSWRAFELNALENRPTAEVASALGMSENAVRLARSRILRRLRDAVAALEET